MIPIKIIRAERVIRPDFFLHVHFGYVIFGGTFLLNLHDNRKINLLKTISTITTNWLETIAADLPIWNNQSLAYPTQLNLTGAHMCVFHLSVRAGETLARHQTDFVKR